MVMTRRNLLGGAAAVSATAVLDAQAIVAKAAADWEPSPFYPDPAIQILDPSFAKYRINNAGVERLEDAQRQTRQIAIKGKPSRFEFTRGTDPKTHEKREQIAGIFEGKQGSIRLTMAMDLAAYHEEEILKMLAGIQ